MPINPDRRQPTSCAICGRLVGFTTRGRMPLAVLCSNQSWTWVGSIHGQGWVTK